MHAGVKEGHSLTWAYQPRPANCITSLQGYWHHHARPPARAITSRQRQELRGRRRIGKRPGEGQQHTANQPVAWED